MRQRVNHKSDSPVLIWLSSTQVLFILLLLLLVLLLLPPPLAQSLFQWPWESLVIVFLDSSFRYTCSRCYYAWEDETHTLQSTCSLAKLTLTMILLLMTSEMHSYYVTRQLVILRSLFLLLLLASFILSRVFLGLLLFDRLDKWLVFSSFFLNSLTTIALWLNTHTHSRSFSAIVSPLSLSPCW